MDNFNQVLRVVFIGLYACCVYSCLKSNKMCHGTIFNFHNHKNVSTTSRSNVNILRPNVASIYWLVFRKSAC